jgi:hypothetical protein
MSSTPACTCRWHRRTLVPLSSTRLTKKTKITKRTSHVIVIEVLTFFASRGKCEGKRPCCASDRSDAEKIHRRRTATIREPVLAASVRGAVDYCGCVPKGGIVPGGSGAAGGTGTPGGAVGVPGGATGVGAPGTPGICPRFPPSSGFQMNSHSK